MEDNSRRSSLFIQSGINPLSFISKGWREVRDSADADLQLMRNRASSIKRLATLFDKEFDNFINSPSPFYVPSIRSDIIMPGDLDFLNRLKPKLTEIRQTYSVSDFRKKAIEQWYPNARLRINLWAIKSAIVDEAENCHGLLGEEEDKNWEPIKALKMRLREFENMKMGLEIFESLKNSEFVEKVKSSLDVPPLDIPELLAYFVRQSGPFLDQLGVRRDICDKIVKRLCSKPKAQFQLRAIPSNDIEDVTDELYLRIANVLPCTRYCHESDSTNGPLNKKRHIAIVTTASLPWMTGTAVNPLFRAAYLAKSADQNVTLMVPWLCRSDQVLVYPNNITFGSPEEQEAYICNWLEERVGFKADFNISFYPGKFSKERRSIIPAGDTSQFIPSKDADIAILEEPEHLNWYHNGRRWTDKFNYVVGIVHTNYLEYIKREKNGAFQAFLVKHINKWVTRAHCNKVLRLSAATQDLPRSVICNVHGVNPKFLKIGEKMAAESETGQQVFSKGAYFLGKMVWAKGYDELINLLVKQKNELDAFKLDVYGNGEDAHEVKCTAKRFDLNINFLEGRDHADDSLHGYKVFVNPSVSDVLCTATAEALAMGKFVVCADHPSNEFFASFPNCLTYKTPEEFVSKVKQVLTEYPKPLTAQQRYDLSWEAAIQRFMECSDLETILKGGKDEGKNNEKNLRKSILMPIMSDMVDGGLAFAHNCLTGNEFLRLCTGAIPGTRNYDLQHCKDLNLLPPNVANPIYGW